MNKRFLQYGNVRGVPACQRRRGRCSRRRHLPRPQYQRKYRGALPGDPTIATVEISDSLAEAGKRPAALARERTTVPVKIVSVDQRSHVVTFFGADKQVRTVTVKKPEAQQFIKQLKPGDDVVFTYTEALAVAVWSAR